MDWLDSRMRAGERGVPDHPATMHIDLTWQDGAIPLRPSRPLRNKAIARERGGDTGGEVAAAPP